MANRVNINITARDMTRGDLFRIRQNFRSLGQDVDRAVGDRTRQNFDRLRQSVNQSRRDLNAMRGAIPDEEFFRLDDALRRSQRTMQRGFGDVGDRAFARVVAQLRDVEEGFRRLDESGQVRVRIDTSALRRADAQLASWRRDQQRNAVRVRVDPDVNRGFGARLARTLTAPFRTTASIAGGILSDGIGQGIVQGFQAGGAAGKVVFAGILAAILSMLGAALSGALVAAFGLAFVGIAGISAATSDRVKKQWSSTLASLKENFAEVGEPMIPVLERALIKLEALGDRITPVFKKAIEDTTPATEGFIDKLFEGISRMGKAMFQPIMDAWAVFGPVFGDVLADSMEMWGESFADMADLVRNNSVEIEMALRGVMKIIDLIIDTVTFFGKMWVFVVGQVGDAIGGIIEFGLRPLLTVALEVFDKVLAGAVAAFSWIPGIGEDLKLGQQRFRDFKDSAYETLDGIAQKAYSWDETMERTNRKRVLQADISKWESQLRRARRDLKNTTNQKAEARVRANIADLESKLRRARSQLNSLNGRVARTYVYTTYTDIHTSLKTRQRRHGLRTGGVVGAMNAAASGGVRQNQTLVGEDGPEIVDLPFGSRVRSNPDTRRLLGSSRRDVPGPVRLMLESGPSDLDRLLLHVLRRAIRSEGGDVQLVLGRGGR